MHWVQIDVARAINRRHLWCLTRRASCSSPGASGDSAQMLVLGIIDIVLDSGWCARNARSRVTVVVRHGEELLLIWGPLETRSTGLPTQAVPCLPCVIPNRRQCHRHLLCVLLLSGSFSPAAALEFSAHAGADKL